MTRFDVMVLTLQGLPVPPLPLIPGRVQDRFRILPVAQDDAFAERWELEHPERMSEVVATFAEFDATKLGRAAARASAAWAAVDIRAPTAQMHPDKTFIGENLDEH